MKCNDELKFLWARLDSLCLGVSSGNVREIREEIADFEGLAISFDVV